MQDKKQTQHFPDNFQVISHENIEGELVKEVYARFGAAYYYSECLHRELCHINAILSFKDKNLITRPRVEEKLSINYSLTMGQLKEKVKDLLPDELLYQLDEAIKKRNFIAHHFWFERIYLMCSIPGMLKMVDELEEYASLFLNLDKKVTELFRAKWQQFGITEEIFQKFYNDLISGKPPEPLLKKRKPKKNECLIRVWEIKLYDGSLSMIFETDDGVLWQLCDIGLGWTYFEEIGTEWKENEKIKPYLPANINPIPKIKTPWNYEFELKNKVVLWVKPGERSGSIVFGLKKK